MRSRDAVGRTIVKVRQRRVYDPSVGMVTDVCYLELDNGAQLVPVVTAQDAAGEDPYTVDLIVRKTASTT
jgi:hypothetical protein